MAFTHLFLRYLREQGLPVTQQREQIADVVLSTDGHLSVEEIEEKLRDRGERIGKECDAEELSLHLPLGPLGMFRPNP